MYAEKLNKKKKQSSIFIDYNAYILLNNYTAIFTMKGLTLARERCENASLRMFLDRHPYHYIMSQSGQDHHKCIECDRS